jgi:vitamin B12 transporter
LVNGLQQFAGAFAQADLSFGRSEAMLGARYDVYGERQAQETMYGLGSGTVPFPASAAHHVSPRIAYRYSFSPHWLARASFGDAFKAPDWGALYSTYPLGGSSIVVGNPLLKAQTADQIEGGAEWNPGVRTRAYATAFSTVQNNRMVIAQVSPTLYSSENVSQARSGGYEVSLQQQIGDHVAVRAGYANTPTRITQEASGSVVGNLIPQTPVSSGYIGARYFNDRYTADVELRSIGRAFADEQNKQPVDGATLVNAGFSRTLGSAGEIYAEVQNAFNRAWLAEATTYAPPRSILFGMRKALR